jgi:predicted alpha/beta hydrolase family esterase
VADLVCAANAMSDAEMPITLLVGHSLGGAACLMAAPWPRLPPLQM